MALAGSLGELETIITYVPQISKTGIMRADYSRAFGLANFSSIQCPTHGVCGGAIVSHSRECRASTSLVPVATVSPLFSALTAEGSCGSGTYGVTR
jgi:hypothetical protein